MKLKRIDLYGEILRRDEEERTVEGYVFVNSEVGDGINLTRSAMEAATDDYMRWGAVREMHGKTAAGTAIDLTWDSKGAYFRAKISDDQAWKKVVDGTYKGFSVGVRPTVVRGKDVTGCAWIENSLVDRPKDPDSVISLHRAESYGGETEFEVEEERADLAEVLTRLETSESERAGLVERVSALETENSAALLRIETAETERAEMVTRLETAESEVTRLIEVSAAQDGLLTRVAGAMKSEEGELLEAVVTRAVEILSKPDPDQSKPILNKESVIKALREGMSAEDKQTRGQVAQRYDEILRTDWSGVDEATKHDALLELEGLKKVLAG